MRKREREREVRKRGRERGADDQDVAVKREVKVGQCLRKKSRPVTT